MKLSEALDLDRLGAFVRIFGREAAADPVRVHWLLVRCRTRGDRNESVEWGRDGRLYIGGKEVVP